MKYLTSQLYLGMAVIYILISAILVTYYNRGDLELLVTTKLFLMLGLNLLIYSKLLKIERRLYDK